MLLIHWPVPLVPGDAFFPLREDGSRWVDDGSDGKDGSTFNGEGRKLSDTWAAFEALLEENVDGELASFLSW